MVVIIKIRKGGGRGALPEAPSPFFLPLTRQAFEWLLFPGFHLGHETRPLAQCLTKEKLQNLFPGFVAFSEIRMSPNQYWQHRSTYL